MLTVLIQGVLTATPQQRTSKTAKLYFTAKLRAKGDDGQSVWCNVIAFDAGAVELLASLTKGDPVAIAGTAAISTWDKDGTPRVGLSVTATRVLSVC